MLADPSFIKKQREISRILKKTNWWKRKKSKGICYYCNQNFLPNQLTMDHIVPLVKGGKSVKANLVPTCMDCNQKKRSQFSFDFML